MKKFLLLIAVGIVLTARVSAQTHAKQDANGNYQATAHKTDTTRTGKTFTDSKGQAYPVYLSAHGKLFYYKTSKSGNVYKVYIKVD